jgi:hypothetical protein
VIIKESLLIDAPMKQVWDTFTDLTCWMDWNTVIQDVRFEDRCLTDGNALKCCFRPFLFPIRVKIRIEEIKPYERIIWSARKKGLFAFHEFFFEEAEKGILVTSKESFSGLLAAASGVLLPVRRMRSLTRTFLKDLKKAAEKRSNPLQPIISE